jgi:hypothetical protein
VFIRGPPVCECQRNGPRQKVEITVGILIAEEGIVRGRFNSLQLEGEVVEAPASRIRRQGTAVAKRRTVLTAKEPTTLDLKLGQRYVRPVNLRKWQRVVNWLRFLLW